LQEKVLRDIAFLQILHQLAREISCGIKHLRVVQRELKSFDGISIVTAALAAHQIVK